MAFNFADKEKDKNNLMVVDALNLAFRWKHAKKTNFVEEYIRTVQSLAHSYNCSEVLITADQGSSAYRKQVYPEYKQNRKDKYETQTEVEKEAFLAFFEEYERTLQELEKYYPVFRFQGVEADDLAAYIVQNRPKYKTDHIWLISSDRDWDLLVGENVSRFSYVTRKEITYQNWAEHYDVPMENYLDYKVLIGDSGDNIPGIDGIGPVRAKALIEEYGTALDILDAVPIAGKYKYIQKINEQAHEVIERNYYLMDLVTFSEDAIGVENAAQVLKKLESL